MELLIHKDFGLKVSTHLRLSTFEVLLLLKFMTDKPKLILYFILNQTVSEPLDFGA